MLLKKFVRGYHIILLSNGYNMMKSHKKEENKIITKKHRTERLMKIYIYIYKDEDGFLIMILYLACL